MNRRLLLILASVAIIFSMLACSFGTPTPAPTLDAGGSKKGTTVIPTATLPQDALKIISLTNFVDEYDYLVVAGEMTNQSDRPISYPELFIEIRDSAGLSLLKDGNGATVEEELFYPMLNTLAAGQSSPFTYSFSTSDGTPDTVNVSPGDYELENSEMARLQAENVHLVQDEYGSYYLSGELVNLDTGWAKVNGLAGGVVDTSGNVLSAGWTGNYASFLAPTGNAAEKDRTPFSLYFSVPPSGVDSWKLWWDAESTSPDEDYSLEIKITNAYFDEYDALHLVGLVTNLTDELLRSMVVAGLYAEDGTCLDANTAYLPYSLEPGDSVAYDISYFTNINYNLDEAASVDNYTVQIDLGNTYAPFYKNLALQSGAESIDKQGSQWTVSGTWTNNSDKNLITVSIVVEVYDAAGTLVATASSSAYPAGDFYAPNAQDAYELFLNLDPAVDAGSLTTRTIVVGEYE